MLSNSGRVARKVTSKGETRSPVGMTGGAFVRAVKGCYFMRIILADRTKSPLSRR
jgi:hypothetical protein